MFGWDVSFLKKGLELGLILIIGVCTCFFFFWLLARIRRWNALAKVRRLEKDFSSVANYIKYNKVGLTAYERWRQSETGEIVSFKSDLVNLTIVLIICIVGYVLLSKLQIPKHIRILVLVFMLIISVLNLIYALRELQKYRRLLLFVYWFVVTSVYVWLLL